MMVALLVENRKVSAGPDVDTVQGCADAVTGFKKAPDTPGDRDGDEVVSPSYRSSTSAPASVASAVIGEDKRVAGRGESLHTRGVVGVHCARVGGHGEYLAGCQGHGGPRGAAEVETRDQPQGAPHARAGVPASLVKRSVSALAEDNTSVGPALPLIAASDRFDDESPS
jgi:hypothetical protein